MKRFSIRYMTITAILIALSVLLASNLCTFYITPSIRISFRDVPVMLASLYCGPVAGVICAVAADLIGTTMSGLGFYPPLTLSAAVIGAIPGLLCLLFKRRPHSYFSVLCGTFAANIAGNIVLSTVFLNSLYGMGIPTLLITRIPQYLLMAAVESYLLFIILNALGRTYPSHAARMSYEQTLEYIHTINWRGSKLGLSRTVELLKLLHNPQNKLKFIHIAGTNGKGSTAAMTASILQAQGYKVGLFVSPFVTVFNERMQINGEYISNEKLSELVSMIKPFAESMKVPPTEFELITATAFTYFQREQCDYVVLEVGLGGELDSTNVISTPLVATITAIGLDHTKILGDSIEKIAKAKAGIIKTNGTVVFYGEDSEALGVIEEACRKNNATLTLPCFDALELHHQDAFGQSFSYKQYSNLWLPLVGSYQIKNAAVVLETIAALRQNGVTISDEAVYMGLHNTKWPARFEVLCRKPLFVVDGGHNPMGVESTMGTCQKLFGTKKLTIIMGVMADKDVSTMLNTILPHASKVFTVTPDNQRALKAETLARMIAKEGVEATPFDTIERAVEQAFDCANSQDIILAVGSLYMAGTVRELVFNRINHTKE